MTDSRMSVLDCLTQMQAAANIRSVSTEALFRSVTYWNTVAIRQERHGRDKQATRLRANVAEIKQLAIEMAMLRTLCVYDPVMRRQRNRIVAANVPRDPELVAWLVGWLDRGAASLGGQRYGC